MRCRYKKDILLPRLQINVGIEAYPRRAHTFRSYFVFLFTHLQDRQLDLLPSKHRSMTPSTRKTTSMYGPIDPGPVAFSESMSQDSDVEMTIDVDESEVFDHLEMDHDPINNVNADRMIIAIDFGTTFSSVAYAVIPKGRSPETLGQNDVRCIGNYPGYEPVPGVLDFRQDVPTELWYDDGRTGSWRQRSEEGSDDDIQDPEDVHEDSSSDDSESEDQRSRSQFDDGNEIESLTNTQSKTTATTRADQYWGYGVQQKLNLMNVPRDEAQPLTRFKLNLVSESDTQDVRDNLKPILIALRKRRIIGKETDIYKHFLTHLLEHTKEQLQFSNELQEDMVIQFVLCVPAKWPTNACRIMQAALEEAVKDVGLSRNAEDDVCNLFIISEPEAAAECILAETTDGIYVRFSSWHEFRCLTR
jgi:hypothetical protein